MKYGPWHREYLCFTCEYERIPSDNVPCPNCGEPNLHLEEIVCRRETFLSRLWPQPHGRSVELHAATLAAREEKKRREEVGHESILLQQEFYNMVSNRCQELDTQGHPSEGRTIKLDKKWAIFAKSGDEIAGMRVIWR